MPDVSSCDSIVQQPLEPLPHRLGGDEPTETLAGVDQTLVAHQLERPSHGDPAGRELGRQLGLARQHRPRRRRTRRGGAARRRSPGNESGALACCPLRIFGGMFYSNLYYSCLHDRERQHPDRTRRSRLRQAARQRQTRPRAARPTAHAGREGAHQPPRRRRTARRSSAAPATPTSTPTEWRCRTPPPRWRCCSS